MIRRLLNFLGIMIVFVTPLVFTPERLPFTFEEHYLIKFTFVQLIVVSIFAAIIFSFLKNGAIKFNLTYLWIPIAALLLLNLSSVLYSPSIGISLNAFSRLLTYILIYLIAANCFSEEENAMKLFSFWKTSIVITCLYAIWQDYNGIEAYSTAGNRNFLASYLVITVPCVFIQLIQDIKNSKKLAAVADVLILLLFVYALFITKSRGGVLALGLISFGCLLAFLFIKGKKLLGLLLITLFLLSSYYFCRSGFVLENIRGDVRPYIWEGVINMIKDNPIFGCGAGAMFIKFPLYRPVEYFLLKKYAYISSHAHNEFLNMWAETGLFSLIAFICLIYLFIKGACSRFRSGNMSMFYAGLCLGLIGILIQSMFDVALNVPWIAVFFWFFLGIVSGRFGGLNVEVKYFIDRKIARISTAAIMFLLLAAYSVFFVIKPAAAQIYFGRGTNAMMAKDWPEAAECFKNGIKYSPHYLYAYYKQAYSYAQAGDYQSAVDAYKKIEKTAPYYAKTSANLGLIYEKMENLHQAAYEYRKWLSINPYDLEAHRSLADIFVKIGKKKEAEIEFRLISELEKNINPDGDRGSIY